MPVLSAFLKLDENTTVNSCIPHIATAQRHHHSASNSLLVCMWLQR